MRNLILNRALWLLISLTAAAPSFAQTQLVNQNFFPSPLEFQELKSSISERDLTAVSDLERLQNAPALLEAGLKRYVERTYALEGTGRLVVSVMTLGDAHSAYSVFSILSSAAAHAGPPGSYFSSEGGALLFVSGNYCAGVRTTGPGDLARRVALSVANRIGTRDPTLPSLLRHVPAEGCDPASARFLIGPKSLASFGRPVAGASLKLPTDVEVAQAPCSVQQQTGSLSLLSFPTISAAEAYFDSGLFPRGQETASIYTRQTGPLVAILEGNFSPENADKTLSAIKFSYSIKWIYDKSKEQGHTIWGVPVKLLGTVVRSILFTALLCLGSIVAGILIAFGRVFARRHGIGAQEDAFIRLKIDEN